MVKNSYKGSDFRCHLKSEKIVWISDDCRLEVLNEFQILTVLFASMCRADLQECVTNKYVPPPKKKWSVSESYN